MAKLPEILDTSVLIRNWRHQKGRMTDPPTPADARAWAGRVISLYRSNQIVTPIAIEMLAGTRDADELRLTREYLGEFHILDEGRDSAADWIEAGRIASRVPRDGHPRHLGDCLIRAIANRYRREVITFDAHFPR